MARTARAVPALAAARFARGCAGAFDTTLDWMPILDESPLGGFFIVAGLSGHGFKLCRLFEHGDSPLFRRQDDGCVSGGRLDYKEALKSARGRGEDLRLSSARKPCTRRLPR